MSMMKYNGSLVSTAAATEQSNAPRHRRSAPSPAEEAWALLRSLLFAERRRFLVPPRSSTCTRRRPAR